MDLNVSQSGFQFCVPFFVDVVWRVATADSKPHGDACFRRCFAPTGFLSLWNQPSDAVQ